MTAPAKSFLGVERSVTGRRWVARLNDERLAGAIARQASVPDVVARVLAARGILPEDAAGYLDPTLRNLMPPPSDLRGMRTGAALIAREIRAGGVIGIIGDYDVDGMSSCAMLHEFLSRAGAPPVVYIPHRVEEGYGPSVEAVEQLHARGVGLLLTVDCGVMAHEPLAHARRLGLETVVVDHHIAGDELPEAAAVINPNRDDDQSGQGHLCAAGVAMILVAAISRELRQAGWWNGARPEPDLLHLLDLVALATVCDVVPLKGLNRAYVRQGLKVMARRERPGLAALADVARLSRKPDTHALGFVLGPRLNAAGRVGSAMQGFELLTAQDAGTARQLADELEELNRRRQAVELSIVEQAVLQAEAMLGERARLPVLVVSGKGWHPGVLGLVAARLKERFDKPSFALCLPDAGAPATGSARSVSGVNLGNIVRAAVEAGVALKGGGHAMAAGVTVEQSRVGDLRAFLEDRLAGPMDAAGDRNEFPVDAALSASAVTPEFIETLERAGPFGSGNPSPVFVLPAHRVIYADRAGADHVRCTLAQADGTRVKAIAFRSLNTELGELLLSERQMPLHIAGRISINDWGGRREGQVFIDDAAEIPRPK